MQTHPLRFLQYLTLLMTLIVTPSFALVLQQPGIYLGRNPAPPDSVPNDGSGSITFYWTIYTKAAVNKSATLEIFQAGYTAPTLTRTIAVNSGTTDGSWTWLVSTGTPYGRYFARLTFYSDWWCDTPGSVEDLAEVSFIISPSARLTICKFLDLNGDGSYDPANQEHYLPNWVFHVWAVDNPGKVWDLTTGASGCTPTISLPVNPCATKFMIKEDLPASWVKTTQCGQNPYQIELVPAEERCEAIGNWRPIYITGCKLRDNAPWPWLYNHWVGPDGQQNPAAWEPTWATLFQPVKEYVPNVPITLLDADKNIVKFVSPNPLLTPSSGPFTFGPINFSEDPTTHKGCYFLSEGTEPNHPHPFAYLGTPAVCAAHNLNPWPGCCPCGVALYQDAAGGEGFSNPNLIRLKLNPPAVAGQVYDCNAFYNKGPSRIWGFMCKEAIGLGLTEIDVQKTVDGVTYDWPAVNPKCCTACGLYIVPALDVEQDGIRSGVYSLIPPSNIPTNKAWVATRYELWGGLLVPTNLPVVNGRVEVDLGTCDDVRIDFCLADTGDNTRRCGVPVTFTQDGWKTFSNTDNKLITNGMVYNKFPLAFAKFTYFGTAYTGKMVVGGNRKITCETVAGAMKLLVAFLPQTGKSGKLDQDYLNPWKTNSAGALAGEVVALQMNIAYNDRRLMPRTPGVDLEKYTLREGLLKGKTVGQVLDIASAILGGDLPQRYGIPNDATGSGYETITTILKTINANYEFVDWDTATDHGFLNPDIPPTSVTGWHYASVPYGS